MASTTTIQRAVGSFAGMAMLGLACGQYDGNAQNEMPLTDESNGVASPSSYVDVDLTKGPPHWPDPSNIPVCWEALDDENQYQSLSPVQPTTGNKDQVAQVVKTQYARAGTGFTGWDPCLPWSKGVRIKISYFRGSSRTNGFGKELNGQKNGMILNWAIKDDHEQNIPAITRITNTALHEFGHALGLHHEMVRPDHTECTEEDYTLGLGEFVDVQSVGDYVPDSIMSYCRDFGSIELSQADIDGIINYYNNPIAAIVDGPRGANNLTEYQFTIGGFEIVGYRYKIGNTLYTDCKSPMGYSDEQSVGNKIWTNLVPLGDGPIRLCVVGKDINSVWQSYNAYTSWFWIQDLTPPAPNAVNKSQDVNKLELYLDDDISRVSYKIGHYANCSDPQGYGHPQDYKVTSSVFGQTSTFIYPIVIDLLSDSIDQSQDLTVCIIAYDEAGNVQSFGDATRFIHSFQL